MRSQRSFHTPDGRMMQTGDENPAADGAMEGTRASAAGATHSFSGSAAGLQHHSRPEHAATHARRMLLAAVTRCSHADGSCGGSSEGGLYVAPSRSSGWFELSAPSDFDLATPGANDMAVEMILEESDRFFIDGGRDDGAAAGMTPPGLKPGNDMV